MSQSAPLLAPPTQAALATRVAIMDTAERLFRTLGYQKTTVADIARELRMSPANVYRFFPSKSAINEAICQRILAELHNALWAVARGPGSAPDRIRALFRLLQEQTIALFFQERRMHDMVAAALEEQWAAIEAHIQTLGEVLSHVIEDGQADGVFGPADSHEAAKLVRCTTVVFTHPTLVEQKCGELGALADLAAGMAEFCLRALRP